MALLRAIGTKVLANLLELLTSKTTWIVLAGCYLDMSQNGGKPTLASLVLLAAKCIQQGAADWGKNALTTTTTTATPTAITATTTATPPTPEKP